MRKATSLFVGCILSASVLAATNSWADEEVVTYKITVTNLTGAQPFAPILAATHHSGMSFYELGQAPSDELAYLAEAGNSGPMQAKLLTMPEVSDAQIYAGGLTKPGKTSTMTVTAKRGMDHVSVGGMLGATNDAFFAVGDVALPKGRQVLTYMADAYDAGSEDNDEAKEHVFGFGIAGAGYSPVPNDKDPFVHVHSGIHGIADLPANRMDWRNPVAEITIERVSN